MTHFKFENLIRKYHFVLFLMLKTMLMSIFNYKIKQKFKFKALDKLEARGKPSTWLPRGGLVEHIFLNLRTKQRTNRPTKQPANETSNEPTN